MYVLKVNVYGGSSSEFRLHGDFVDSAFLCYNVVISDPAIDCDQDILNRQYFSQFLPYLGEDSFFLTSSYVDLDQDVLGALFELDEFLPVL